MKKMVFSLFNVYEQERGTETQQNQYENMGEQALLNEMETHFGTDKDTYGKLQRASGYKNFFTAVMNKLMKDDPSYPKDGSFTDKVGYYQSTYMDIHKAGDENFKVAADKKLGPTTRDYMKGWLQAVVDQSANAVTVAPVKPKPIYSLDTAGISNLKIDSLPKSGSIDLVALRGVSIENKLNDLGINQYLYQRGKDQSYLTNGGELNLFRSNPYNITPDKKNIIVNFMNNQKITLPLASIVDKANTGDIIMDEKFKFSGANFTRAVFAEFPKKITETTDKTIGTYQATFDAAYNGCMNTLKTNKGWDEKINAINTTIGVLEPIQRKVYDTTKKEGANVYYEGTLAEKTANQMYNQIQGLKLQLEAHTTGKEFFNYWYDHVATEAIDENDKTYKTTHFDLLKAQADAIDPLDPRPSEINDLNDNINELSRIYESELLPRYSSYQMALVAANPQATVKEEFNPARFADILNNSRTIHTQGENTLNGFKTSNQDFTSN